MNLQKNSPFKQGIYSPKNKHKFLGRNAIYRSSMELRFMQWLDMNEKVTLFSSENVVIQYRSPIDSKIHRYYPDNVVHIKEGDKIVKYLIEIKPYKQTIPPEPSNRKKKSTILYEQLTWQTNQAKFSAASDWCKRKTSEGDPIKFLIITERELLV